MISDALMTLIGKWQGTNRLWLDPAEPARDSEGTAVLQTVAQQQFLSLHYTWAEGGKPQDGQLLVGQNGELVQAAWVDSWHMQNQIMQLSGTPQADGGVTMRGSYAAPPDPDWGWRITIEPQSADQFTFRMHNITPQGEEMLAVEVQFSRTA